MTNKRRKWLATTEEEFWAYMSIAMLALAYLIDLIFVAAGLLALATIFWAIYLFRSFPKLRAMTDLTPAVRRLGYCWNVAWTVLHVGFMAAKIWMLVHHVEVMDYLRRYFNGGFATGP